MQKVQKSKKSRVVKYNKWGYIFMIPFAVVYLGCALLPLLSTIVNSFFENYRSGLMQQVGPNFIGIKNYISIFSNNDIWVYTQNTLIMWLLGFVPQILVSIILGAWFTDIRLKLKGTGFFRTVIYMPNLIMASAFAMLFFTLFADNGPVNSLLMQLGVLEEPFKFLSNTWSARSIVAFLNFIMWFGNTTMLLMAGIMGIDTALFEAAQIDGGTSMQVFLKVTLPIIRPVVVYVVITSLIGGLQMFDVPQVLTNGTGDPMRSTMTLLMYLNKHLSNQNYGMGGALSVIFFVVTGILSVLIYRALSSREV